MKVVKKVPVKVVLTEKEREAQHNRLTKQYERMEREVEQFHFERKKMERKHGSLPSNIEERLGREVNQRKAKIEAINYQMEQLKVLPDLHELTVEEVESVVEVREGMEWKVLEEREIVVEDGFIKRVRDA